MSTAQIDITNAGNGKLAHVEDEDSNLLFLMLNDDEIIIEETGTEPPLPSIMYVSGNPDKAATPDSIQYTGGWFINAENYSAEIPGFVPTTLFTREGEQVAGQGCFELPPLFVLNVRRSVVVTDNKFPVRFAREEWDDAREFAEVISTPKAKAKARGRLQIRVAFEGFDEVFALTFGGTVCSTVDNGGFQTPGLLQVWKRKVPAQYTLRRRNVARGTLKPGQTASETRVPSCLFRLVGLAGGSFVETEDKKGKKSKIPNFISVGENETTMVTRPIWTGEPSGNADDALLGKLFVGDRTERSRLQLLVQAGETWADAWSAANLGAARERRVAKAVGNANPSPKEETPESMDF